MISSNWMKNFMIHYYLTDLWGVVVYHDGLVWAASAPRQHGRNMPVSYTCCISSAKAAKDHKRKGQTTDASVTFGEWRSLRYGAMLSDPRAANATWPTAADWFEFQTRSAERLISTLHWRPETSRTMSASRVNEDVSVRLVQLISSWFSGWCRRSWQRFNTCSNVSLRTCPHQITHNATLRRLECLEVSRRLAQLLFAPLVAVGVPRETVRTSNITEQTDK